MTAAGTVPCRECGLPQARSSRRACWECRGLQPPSTAFGNAAVITDPRLVQAERKPQPARSYVRGGAQHVCRSCGISVAYNREFCSLHSQLSISSNRRGRRNPRNSHIPA